MAQSFAGLSSSGPPAFTAALSPTNPAPYSTAILSVDSTVLTLANATLTVSVGGTQIYQGNVQDVQVPIGAPGALTAIRVTLASAGQSYSQLISIRPGDVSLVQEPLATVPLLYPGKPLLPFSGQVRLVAVAGFRTASGAAIDPATLSYSWSQDGSVIGSGSGIGQESVIVGAPLQYRSSSVSVTVSTQDGAQVGSASVALAPQASTVRIYASDPLLGIRFDHALAGRFAIKDTEASFYAAPYSFALSGSGPALTWFLNGSAVGSGSSITLRPTGSGAGSGSLSLSADEPANYESASASLSLSFGGTSGSNLFGL
jgi:hypothetical protein